MRPDVFRNGRSRAGSMFRRGFSAALLGLMLCGCATGPNANPLDPMEPLNRSVFTFNDAVDRAVLKPVATAYRQVTPQPIRIGVGNFFANLEDAWSFGNSVLQLKGQGAVDNFMRFVVNTFFGLAGVVDIASDLGIERHPEDLGKTLGHWGVESGPYVVLPLLGPSTLRDTLVLPIYYKWDFVSNIENLAVRDTLVIVNLIDTRANLLKSTAVIEGAALDKYTFTRDAYIQLRRNAIYDGNPPDEVPEEKPPSK